MKYLAAIIIAVSAFGGWTQAQAMSDTACERLTPMVRQHTELGESYYALRQVVQEHC